MKKTGQNCTRSYVINAIQRQWEKGASFTQNVLGKEVYVVTVIKS